MATRRCLACTLAMLVTAAALADVNNVTLHVLSPATADKYGAYCLDGTPPAFYYRIGSRPTAWKIHFRGGGWAFDVPSAYERSLTELGSSKYCPAQINTTDNAIYGFMDANATNPFGDWSFVLALYCDGSSFTSSLTTPVHYNGTSLYFRGFNILTAMIHELDTIGGFLSRATEVVVTGTSAGGIAAYQHASYIKSLLPSSTRVVALPDAGFFLDHANMEGAYAFRQQVQGAVGPSVWNATSGLHQGCVRATPPADLWQCFFPQYLFPYETDVPFFMLNSMYDTASLSMILEVNCDIWTNCNAAEMQAIEAYHLAIQGNVTKAATTFGPRDGFFLTSCYQHEESCRDFDWFGITITGSTPNSTFTTWYGAGGGAATRMIDVVWPNDTSCAPPTAHHGGC